MKKRGRGGGRIYGDGRKSKDSYFLGVILRMLRPLALRCCSSRAARCCSIIFWKKPAFFFLAGESTGMGKRRIRAVCPMEMKFCVVQFRARALAKFIQMRMNITGIRSIIMRWERSPA